MAKRRRKATFSGGSPGKPNLTIKVTGVDTVMRNLRRIVEGRHDEATVAFKQVLDEDMEKARAIAPKQTGALRSTGKVTEDRSGKSYRAVLSFGGPSTVKTSSGNYYVDYAVRVHEEVEAKRLTGEPKFLQSTVNDNFPDWPRRTVAKMGPLK
jgi:hypothetical protein